MTDNQHLARPVAFAKRAFDIAGALTALALTLPLWPFIALAIRLDSKGPIIFRQLRIGRALTDRTEMFMMMKFRSMVVDAEAGTGAVWAKKNDPRITRVGAFLRKTRLDELPQLLNVLRGDMSLVGPRPAVPEEVERYERWQRRRLRMRPGLTCLWTLAGRDALDFDTWMKMDMQYIDNWSLALDWRILLYTIPRVLTGKGAY
jgi:exopolysaccharide biosynthesis polyprenyl glycosylphosphotransferase